MQRSTFRSSTALAALLFALVATPQVASAQTTFEIGPRAGLELNDVESLVIGGDLRVSTRALPFQVQVGFDSYFAEDDQTLSGVSDPNVFRFTGNALYEVGLGRNEVFTPYFGPGLSLTRVSGGGEDETDVGLNVVGGAEFELANFGFGAVRPFVQAEFVPLGGDTQPFQVVGGLLFQLGSN